MACEEEESACNLNAVDPLTFTTSIRKKKIEVSSPFFFSLTLIHEAIASLNSDSEFLIMNPIALRCINGGTKAYVLILSRLLHTGP